MRSHAKAVVAVSALLLTLALGASSASAAAPVVSIDPASEIGVTTAQATGEVNPEGKETSWHFEYISDAAFGVHQDAEQKLTVAATAGTYTLSFQGQSTKAIAFEASPATIEEALNALSTIGGVGGSVSVSGGPGDESGSAPYTITFGGSLEETNVEQISVDGSALTISADPEPFPGSAWVETTVQGRAEGFEGANEFGFGGFSQEEAEAIPGLTPVSPATIEGLAPATTYHLRLVASNEDGATEAVAATFETDPATPPALTVDPASAVAYTTATISGSVDPEGGNVNPIGGPVPIFWQLQYALASEPGNWQLAEEGGTIEGAEAEGSDPIAVSANLTNLKPSSEYDFRLIVNYAGSLAATSSEESFETLAVTAPSVSVEEASAITGFGAHFSGEVEVTSADPAFDAECNFDYITDELFNQNEANSLPGFTGAGSIACSPTPVKGTETQPVEVQADPKLEPNTTYRLRLRASNLGGTSTGEAPDTFTTTALAPTLGKLAHHQLGDGEVAIAARVNPRNSAIADCHFEYGPTASYGQSAPCEALPPTDNEGHLVRAVLSGLTPGATYHFKLFVSSTAGNAESGDASFTLRSAATQSSCPNAGKIGVGFLPGCRAWEMVSPPDKNGGDVGADSTRTRAAADGNAVTFLSTVAFGDTAGHSVSSDYMAQRSADPDPGHNGWSTHSLMPKQDSGSFAAITGGVQSHYMGDLSPDLGTGAFFTLSPLTADPDVAEVPNLYLRQDLRSPGEGTYELLSACPLCAEAGGAPLPPLLRFELQRRPVLVGAADGFSTVVFELEQKLTKDAEEAGGPAKRVRLYEAENGAVRLAGRVPASPAIECDDASGPACVPVDMSVAGQGWGLNHTNANIPHVVSDGSDGHVRVFFTRPTNNGTTTATGNFAGDIYMREDGLRTVQLNASENPGFSGFAKARILDAAADGSRVFFESAEQLTTDATGENKLYMYDATKPASADNLTFMHPDGSGATFQGIVGLGEDGRRVYMILSGGLYLWEEGEITYIGRAPPNDPTRGENSSHDENITIFPRQARVSADGKHVLFSTTNGQGLLSEYGGIDYDHGSCITTLGGGCRELYLYSAEADRLLCASCRPDGAPATATANGSEMASTFARDFVGAGKEARHESAALSGDGRYVFFSTAEPLDEERDINGKIDAYVYDTASETPHLLSSGRSPTPSYFLEASPDGSDAFIATREQLSGWDADSSYDLYDARVGGGFPEPPPAPPTCIGDACQPAPRELNDPTPSSASVGGPGDPRARGHRKARCPKGKRRVRARGGKSRCVAKNKKRKRAANANRRAGK